MAGANLPPTDPVAAAFARLAADAHAPVPPEAQYHPTGKRLDRLLDVINGLLVLGILLAVAISTYALLNL